MANIKDTSYVDEKGRRRWRRNAEIANEIKRLGNFLIICGYAESHAKRYGMLAYTISRYPESVVGLHKEGHLNQIPGVGTTIAGIIGEFLETGTCAKMEEWAKRVPKSVLELTAIPGLGAKTIRTLSRKHHIKSLSDLNKALDTGKLEGIKGIGSKTLERMRQFISGQEQ